MSSSTLDLATMFKAASKSLKQNQASLNQADDLNHNHGDNMVETFNVITKAVAAKKDAPPSDQLAYASQVLRQKANSGSAVVYSDGLQRAAQQFSGKQVTPESAVDLISALMGGGSGQSQSSSPAGGLLGSLLGGGGGQSQQGGGAGDLLGSLLGGGSGQSQQGSGAGDLLGSLLGGGSSGQSQQSSGSGDMLGSLLGGLTGGSSSQQSQQSSGGMDTGDLLNIGMQLFQAYQASSGKPSSQSASGGLVGSLLDSLLSNSSMGSSSHRSESGKLVVDALLKIASQYLNKRRAS